MPKDRVKTIISEAGHIIHMAHSYIDDGNINRLAIIEMGMRNIQAEIDKVREESVEKTAPR